MSGVGNAFQNVSGAVTNNAPITRIGVVNTSYGQNLAFHQDAFIFASADLEDVSRYGAWGSRQSMDGISMRLAQQYSISADTVATRFDILWGFTAAYPELAVRGWHALA
jgi:P22 coat protein - gene protein 5